MSRVIFRTMLLGFLRDRGALAMSFLLPIAFFLVFAAIFAGATGEQFQLKLAVADEVRSEESGRLVRALEREAAFTLADATTLSAAEVRERVRLGNADVGLIVSAGGAPLGRLGGLGAAPLILVVDPARAVAARMAAGLVQKVYLRSLPDVALRGVARLIEQDFVSFDDGQKKDLEDGLADLKKEALEAEARAQNPPSAVEDLFDEEAVAGRGARQNHVAYYAGAVAVLFLLFSAVHGAITLLDERDMGVLDRVLAGPAGMGALVRGKFLFLVAEGMLQVTVIFLVAWLVYGVDLPGHVVGYLLVTAAAATAAAGLALAVTTACATRRQAQTLSNIAILIVSAIGGSMVPRFFMPPWVRELGAFTPTAWALEGYSALFWRDEPLRALALPVSILMAIGLAGYALARGLARRWETL